MSLEPLQSINSFKRVQFFLHERNKLQAAMYATDGSLQALATKLQISLHQAHKELKRLELLETFYKQREYKGWIVR